MNRIKVVFVFFFKDLFIHLRESTSGRGEEEQRADSPPSTEPHVEP